MSYIITYRDSSELDNVKDFCNKTFILLRRAANIYWQSNDGEALLAKTIQYYQDWEPDASDLPQCKQTLRAILEVMNNALDLNIASCERWKVANGISAGINALIPGLNQAIAVANAAVCKKLDDAQKECKQLKEEARQLCNKY